MFTRYNQANKRKNNRPQSKRYAMSCYIIYHYNIIDKERIELLGPLSVPIVEKFGGKLVIANNVECLEGSSAYSHMVVYQFNSTALAKRFYESEESRALSKLRNEVTEGFCRVNATVRDAQIKNLLTNKYHE